MWDPYICVAHPTGQDYAAPVGPHGRVILKIAADKVNTPRLLGR